MNYLYITSETEWVRFSKPNSFVWSSTQMYWPPVVCWLRCWSWWRSHEWSYHTSQHSASEDDRGWVSEPCDQPPAPQPVPPLPRFHRWLHSVFLWYLVRCSSKGTTRYPGIEDMDRWDIPTFSEVSGSMRKSGRVRLTWPPLKRKETDGMPEKVMNG